ncbi:integrin alpha-PS5-like [Thrips palmi]|uniref:Integrin alpha-PS5-like n=1 Tax=Thrips palmi TaxID=161013 RepID=A0A6P8Z305_THRPL|nr:integrin alpha-PS5-like [Thrips palmi]
MLAVVAAVLLAVAAPPRAVAFNADANHAVVFDAASEDLLFGYSVALASGQLLVGEPKGSWLTRADLHQPGALHRCAPSLGPSLGPSPGPGGNAWGAPGASPRCTPAVLEGKEDAYIGGQRVQHLKNDSMFASAVVTTSAGMTLVCGPGWKNQMYKNKHYLMNGLCYALTENLSRPYAPLADTKQGAAVPDPSQGPGATKNVFNYAFGEAGFSAHISQDETEVLLGAPGVLQWRGSVIRYRISPVGQLIEKVVTSTETLQDCSYFGYSVTAGRFRVGAPRDQYAAGAPRAALTGKVLLFELADDAAGDAAEMTPLQEVLGEQLGEYFGAAVLAVDVTGDGLADLLVGAPLHTRPERGDEGRVYVYVNDGEGRLRRTEAPLTPTRDVPAHHRHHGEHGDHGPRFGSAIAAAGDVNRDGFNDVWVGAPFEDGGRGAVYLFLGSSTGLRIAAAQRVAARDVHRGLRAFGFSMAAGEDLDGNGYADLAVGAPLSGYAAVLLSRPAARLVPRMTPSSSELPLSATSFVLTACLEYTGPRAEPQAAASVSLWLDGPSGQMDRAALQLAGRQLSRQVHYVQSLALDRRSCTNVTVVIRPDIDDFTIPIDVTMRFNLTDEASRRDRPFCKACPVLDPAAPTTASLKVPFATGCANDAICRPNLSVAVEWRGASLPLVLGSSRQVTLRVLISNAGEPAFLAKLAVTLPAPLGVARMPAACHAPRTEASATTLLLCDVANPLGRHAQATLDVPLDVSAVSLSPDGSAAPVLGVLLNATSAANSLDTRPEDNVLAATLPMAAVVDLDLVGRASPELGLLPQQSGAKPVRFTHTYEVGTEWRFTVHTAGPTAVQAVSLRMLLPAKARLGGSRGRLVTLLQMQVLVDGVRAACAASEATKAEQDDRLAPARPAAVDSEDVQDAEDVQDVDGGLRCGAEAVVCVQLECQLSLQRGSSTRVDLQLRLLTEALLQVVGPSARAVAVHTKGVVVPPRVARLPAGTKVTIARPVQLSTLFMRPSESAPVQPWVVGLSVAAGLLLLMLLTLALAKAGFFGRKKVPLVGEVPPERTAVGAEKAPGPGPADDDTLLATKDAVKDLEDAEVPDNGSDSGMSSTVDAAHANRK